MAQETIYIDGMTCEGCARRIEKVLAGMAGVREARVSYTHARALVVYHTRQVNPQALRAAIAQSGYTVLEGRKRSGAKAGIALVVLAVYLLLRHTGLLDFTALFPTAEVGMEYGALFVIGLLTSVHCMAMCGGLNLTQCVPAGAGTPNRASGIRPGLLYNAGRVLSYTLVGGVVGALGSVLSLPPGAGGLVQMAAAVFMVIMGVSMLGLFPGLARFVPRLPGGLGERMRGAVQGKGPLLIGLLNGLMPCGPLQAMQFYALSTGSPAAGALSMLLFGLGTVPLMLGLSVFSSLLSRRFTGRMVTAGAALVVALGISMLQSGLALTGIGPVPAAISGDSPPRDTAIVGDVQVVHTQLSPFYYEPITVEVGVPVQWTVEAQPGTVNGCNGRLMIPEYAIEQQLEVGENVIRFTPQESGVYRYSCWMGMIRSTITVEEEGAAPAAAESPARVATYEIPVDTLAVARLQGDMQSVSIRLERARFSPAVVVMQAGVEAAWTIDNVDGMDGMVAFPDYGVALQLEPGENTVSVLPVGDFVFWMGDGSFVGYVKVVEDLSRLDETALLQELDGLAAGYGGA